MRPILRIGLQRIVRGRGARVVTGGVDQAIQCAGTGDMGGQGDVIAFLLISLVDASIIQLIRGR